MEKVDERLPEPEPVHLDRNIEKQQLRQARDRDQVALLPRVLKAADTPWSKGMMAFHRRWVSIEPSDRLVFAPIVSMGVREQILEAGMKGGRHRHINEAIFYIMEGEGYEVHNGKRYEWSAGDVVTVPSYCDHQHLNSNPKQSARMFYSGSGTMVDFLAVNWLEQIEMISGYSIPADAKPIYGPDKKMVGYRTADGQEFKLGVSEDMQKRINTRPETMVQVDLPGNAYEDYMKLAVDELAWKQSAPHVVKDSEAPFENTRMGRIKFFVSPRRNCGLKAYDAFVQELPPGGASGKHRHAFEEVHKILSGRGYDVHDGVRHDWEAEDVVCIPPYVTHQHFNRDSERTARFVAFHSRWYAFVSGGIEHLQDAPDYHG